MNKTEKFNDQIYFKILWKKIGEIRKMFSAELVKDLFREMFGEFSGNVRKILQINGTLTRMILDKLR